MSGRNDEQRWKPQEGVTTSDQGGKEETGTKVMGRVYVRFASREEVSWGANR